MYSMFIYLSVSETSSIVDLIKQFSELLKHPPNEIPDYLVDILWFLLLVIVAFVIIYTVTKKHSPKRRKNFKLVLKISKGEDNSTNDN